MNSNTNSFISALSKWFRRLSKSRVVDTPYIKIEDNALQLSGICIQLKNVSVIEISRVPLPKWIYLVITFCMAFAGLKLDELRLYMYDPPWYLFLMSFLLLGAGIVGTVLWVKLAHVAWKSRCLSIATNSTCCYRIEFRNTEFMYQVLQQITAIFRHPEIEQNFYVNVADCKFSDSANVISSITDRTGG